MKIVFMFVWFKINITKVDQGILPNVSLLSLVVSKMPEGWHAGPIGPMDNCLSNAKNLLWFLKSSATRRNADIPPGFLFDDLAEIIEPAPFLFPVLKKYCVNFDLVEAV